MYIYIYIYKYSAGARWQGWCSPDNPADPRSDARCVGYAVAVGNSKTSFGYTRS